MKKKLIFVCIFILILASAALCACSENSTTTCTSHTDANGDLNCDSCGTRLEPDHTVCTDDDKNLICDVCEKSVPCTHADENNDSVCDIDACKWNYDHTHQYGEQWLLDADFHWHEITCDHNVEPEKLAHTDEDNNGICDGCEWDYDHTHTFSKNWTYDAESHWREPTCGHKINVAAKTAHKDSNNDGLCDSCSWDYGHTHEYSDEWSHDDTNHWREPTCGHNTVVSDKAQHADKDNDGICDGCEWDYGHTHEYSDEWSHDNVSHWREPTCGHNTAVSDEARHDDKDNDGICDGCKWDYGHTHTYSEEFSSNDTHHWYSPICGHDVEDIQKDVHRDEDKDGKCDSCSYQTCKQHTFNTSVWEGNALYHWHPSTCGCKFVSEITEHTDVDGTLTCDMCGVFYEDPNPDEPEYDGPIITTPPHYIGGNKPKDEENP